MVINIMVKDLRVSFQDVKLYSIGNQLEIGKDLYSFNLYNSNNPQVWVNTMSLDVKDTRISLLGKFNSIGNFCYSFDTPLIKNSRGEWEAKGNILLDTILYEIIPPEYSTSYWYYHLYNTTYESDSHYCYILPLDDLDALNKGDISLSEIDTSGHITHNKVDVKELLETYKNVIEYLKIKPMINGDPLQPTQGFNYYLADHYQRQMTQKVEGVHFSSTNQLCYVNEPVDIRRFKYVHLEILDTVLDDFISQTVSRDIPIQVNIKINIELVIKAIIRNKVRVSIWDVKTEQKVFYKEYTPQKVLISYVDIKDSIEMKGNSDYKVIVDHVTDEGQLLGTNYQYFYIGNHIEVRLLSDSNIIININ